MEDSLYASLLFKEQLQLFYGIVLQIVFSSSLWNLTRLLNMRKIFYQIAQTMPYVFFLKIGSNEEHQ